jgi:hypothetical protein
MGGIAGIFAGVATILTMIADILAMVLTILGAVAHIFAVVAAVFRMITDVLTMIAVDGRTSVTDGGRRREGESQAEQGNAGNTGDGHGKLLAQSAWGYGWDTPPPT